MRSWSQEEVKFLRRVCKRLTMQQVATELGRSHSSVATKAKILKIRFRKTGENNHLTRYTDHTVYLALALADDGMPAKVVAEKLEVSKRTVEDWVSGRYRSNYFEGVEQ